MLPGAGAAIEPFERRPFPEWLLVTRWRANGGPTECVRCMRVARACVPAGAFMIFLLNYYYCILHSCIFYVTE